MNSEETSGSTCTWRTGVNVCRMRRSSVKYCLFHQHWVRLVDHGVLGRQQDDELVEWLEQFQPYGPYGNQPGQWWASVDALWPALKGVADPPVLTDALSNELYLRRAQVSYARNGREWTGDPWPRLTGYPLPGWPIDANERVLPQPAAMRVSEASETR